MSAQLLPPSGDRAHCQVVPVMPLSPSVNSALNRVGTSTQPRGGVMTTVPSSSASVTVTVASNDFDRGLFSSSSVAVTSTR